MENFSEIKIATMQQINNTVKLINVREQRIENLSRVVDETNDAAARNKEAKARIKELREFIDDDKAFVRKTADSYEMLTGEAAGVGDLFNQVKEV